MRWVHTDARRVCTRVNDAGWYTGLWRLCGPRKYPKTPTPFQRRLRAVRLMVGPGTGPRPRLTTTRTSKGASDKGVSARPER